MFGHDDQKDKTNHSAAADDSMVTPLDDTTSDDSTSPAFVSGHPAAEPDEETVPPISVATPSVASPTSTDKADLLDIKQEALKHLTPLVGHLNQTPEEKFRTTMMMIQASDDQNLIKDAYQAAQGISDEKTKAQALLDIINEINYFTQQG